VDELPEDELVAAERIQARLPDTAGDPLLRAFSRAPDDDEWLMADDEAAIPEAERVLAAREDTPWEVVRALANAT
jgi:hypothetical protein